MVVGACQMRCRHEGDAAHHTLHRQLAVGRAAPRAEVGAPRSIGNATATATATTTTAAAAASALGCGARRKAPLVLHAGQVAGKEKAQKSHMSEGGGDWPYHMHTRTGNCSKSAATECGKPKKAN